MNRCALLLLLVPVGAIAAPVPKDAQTEERFLAWFKTSRFWVTGAWWGVAA